MEFALRRLETDLGFSVTCLEEERAEGEASGDVKLDCNSSGEEISVEIAVSTPFGEEK